MTDLMQNSNEEDRGALVNALRYGIAASMNSQNDWLPSYCENYYQPPRVSAQPLLWAIAGGCAVLILSGSGGRISNLTTLNSSGGLTTLQSPAPTLRPGRKQVLTAQERIRVIKTAFSLTVSDLAAVLAVGRPAVYDWLNGGEPRRKNSDRIGQLYSFAQFWSSSVSRPMGQLLRSTFEDGHSVYELLIQDNLPLARIQGDLDVLSKNASQRETMISKPSIAERIRSGGFGHTPSDTRAISRRQLSPSWTEEE